MASFSFGVTNYSPKERDYGHVICWKKYMVFLNPR